MPLFMVISGYFSLSIFSKTIKEVLVEKFFRLGVPIIVWMIIDLIITRDIYSLKGCLWFLKCLLVCYYLSRLSTLNMFNKYWGMLAVMVLLILLPHSNLWNVLYMYPFFIIGIFIRDKQILHKLSKRYSNYTLAFFSTCLYCFCFLFWKGVYSQDVCRWHPLVIDSTWFHDLMIFIFRIIIGASAFFMFYYILLSVNSKKYKMANWISFIGKYSLGIYAMQTYAILFLQAII